MACLLGKENGECVDGEGGTGKTALSHRQVQSHPAQRGRIYNSPGIPSDWTEGPSHGSGAEGTADRDAVWITGKMSYEVRLEVRQS